MIWSESRPPSSCTLRLEFGLVSWLGTYWLNWTESDSMMDPWNHLHLSEQAGEHGDQDDRVDGEIHGGGASQRSLEAEDST
jgi:hypothetical protein